MAGLGGSKKRSGASTSRISRFSEVLGAAQESVQASGYPTTQETTQPDTQEADIQTKKNPEEDTTLEQNTQISEYPDMQPSTQPKNQSSRSKKEEAQKSGYPNTQTSKQSSKQENKNQSETTQAAKKAATQIPGYPGTHKPAQPDENLVENKDVKATATETIQVAGYPDTQKSEQPKTQKSKGKGEKAQIPGYPNAQKSRKSADQDSGVADNSLDKIPKRENPEYTQTTFRIPKKLSRQINRALMDLADEGVAMDRSDLLEHLAGAFIRLADDVGVVKALEQYKILGTQVSR